MSELLAATTGHALDLEGRRIVVAVNPRASAAGMAGAVTDNLRGGGLDLPVIQEYTVAGGVAANQEHFARILEPGDIVVGVTGDGGFRSMGAALLHPLLAPHRQEIALTTFGGGDACDMRHALHGRRNRRSPTEILQHAVVRPVRPLLCEVRHDSTDHHLAFSYAGFGVSGSGAATVITPGYRQQQRLWRESRILLHSIFGGHRMWYHEVTPPAGEAAAAVARPTLREASELAAIINPRMAKYGRIPVRHWEDNFFLLQAGPDILDKAVGMTRLALGRPSGEHREAPFVFAPLIDPQQPLIAQFDGETVNTPIGAEITLGRMSVSFNLIFSPC